MKKTALCLCIIAVLSGCMMLCACSEKDTDTEPVSNGYTVIKADEKQQQAVIDTVNSYLKALEDKSISELLECADKDFSLCTNETAFQDMTNELQSAVLERIDFDSFQIKDDRMLVCVDYRLTYSGSFTDPEGVSRTPGEYSRKEVFTLKDDGGYRILSTEKTAEG